MTSDAGIERGAFIPPSDTYCDADRVEVTAEWQVRPRDELDEAGMYACSICHDEDGGSS